MDPRVKPEDDVIGWGGCFPGRTSLAGSFSKVPDEADRSTFPSHTSSIVMVGLDPTIHNREFRMHLRLKAEADVGRKDNASAL
jgi:hypothetical protein